MVFIYVMTLHKKLVLQLCDSSVLNNQGLHLTEYRLQKTSFTMFDMALKQPG